MHKVFIVDDMELVRREVKRLKLWGEPSGFIIVDEAENGQEALKKLEKEPVDLVITDIRMPIIDGIELVKKVTEKRFAPCVALLSDYTEFNYARQGFIYGAFDYLGKPVDEGELSKLLVRVKQYLTERRQEEEKLKQLEGIAEEKLETFYPAQDVERLISYIEQGDSKVIEACNSMVSSTAAAFQYDLAKTAVVINHAMYEVINAIIAKNEWIKLFLDTTSFRNNTFSKCSDWEMLKAAVCEQTEQLSSFMVKFAHSNENNNTVKQICLFALEQIDGDISVTTISERLFISKTYLSELFKQKTGLTLSQYLMMVKMERAKKLVQDGVLKNYEIAEKLKYKDIEYFSKLFKKYTGMSPNEFRRQRTSTYIL